MGKMPMPQSSGTCLSIWRIISFDDGLAQQSARLFNAIQRPRRLRVDVMIAATAIDRKARLATLNHHDFKPLVPLGLELANPI
jgi:predicted nucleic acid-binding protein